MLKRLKHISRLGAIKSIRGYRYRATRRNGDSTINTTFERVLVVGENGTARFDGVCWNYSGTGPCALVELLEVCGVPNSIAKDVAFNSHRFDTPGTDWSINVDNGTFIVLRRASEAQRDIGNKVA